MDGAPITYTERKDGVKPEYNPRTDRWEIAIDAMDAVSKAKVAKRMSAIEERKKALEEINKGGKQDGGAESVQGT